VITTNNLLEGTAVHAGQILCLVSGSSLTDNNITLKYTEAKNNYEKAKSDFERLNELAGDNIISGKEMLNAKNAYENAKALFDNLNQDYSAAGQLVKSPMNGYIKQIFVRNGMHVETGQPIASVTQDKTLWLSAELPGRYASMLTKIQSATIRENTNGQVFSLEELNGKILSVGKAVNPDNFLIPVTLQVENKGQFVNGSFVQVSLKTVTDNKALTVASSALLEDQGSYFVWVQITPELFEKRMVNIGGTDGIKTEIMAGLNENERVVTRGAVMIKLAQATGGLDAHAGHVH
jgi:RND family efflux transporter MFP subunit